jgi:hypothetical protein
MKTLLVASVALFAVACGGQSTDAKAPEGAPADTAAAAADTAAPAADTAAPAADTAAPAAEAPKK